MFNKKFLQEKIKTLYICIVKRCLSILIFMFNLVFLYAGSDVVLSGDEDISEELRESFEYNRGALPMGWVAKEETPELMVSQRLSLRMMPIIVQVIFEYDEVLLSFGTSETSAKGHTKPHVYYASEICSRISRFNI